MIETERKSAAVNLLNKFEELWFLKRPEFCRRGVRTGSKQQEIYGPPTGFICRFHASDIRIRAYVVRSHKKNSPTPPGLPADTEANLQC